MRRAKQATPEPRDAPPGREVRAPLEHPGFDTLLRDIEDSEHLSHRDLAKRLERRRQPAVVNSGNDDES